MAKRNLNEPIRHFISKVHTTVHPDHTIEEALATLRKKDIHDKIVYFYVVDDEGKLQGVVSTRTLLLKPSRERVSDVMDTEVMALQSHQTLQEAMEHFGAHHLLAFPVVDGSGHFLGVIDVQLYFEENVDVIHSQRRSDLFQMIGVYLEEGKKLPPWREFRARMPWIFCNMFGGIACAIISFFYQIVLAKVVLLAMFIPLILTLSESISMQSMTQSLQVLRRHTKFEWRFFTSRILYESRALILIAGTCALCVGTISTLWSGGLGVAATIAAGIFCSVMLTATIGALVPVILHARKRDPKVAAGPVVLMFADVLTTAIYLTFATWWLL